MEIWSFCHSMQKNVPVEHQGEFGFGDVWTWTALESGSKLIVSYLVGLRDSGYATEFIRDVASPCEPRAINQTLKVTPAMAARLTTKLWEIDDLPALLDE